MDQLPHTERFDKLASLISLIQEQIQEGCTIDELYPLVKCLTKATPWMKRFPLQPDQSLSYYQDIISQITSKLDEFSNRTRHGDIDFYIDQAKKEAKKSHHEFKHGAVIVSNKGDIISRGHNHGGKTPFSTTKSTHAEIDALNKLGNKLLLKGAVMYVVRVNNNGITFSMPCDECQSKLNAVMDKFGLKYVFYTVG